MDTLFMVCLITLFFIYVMYGPIMLALRSLKKPSTKKQNKVGELPGISLIIPAFNEEEWIKEKIQNSLSLDYPKAKLEVVVVTDGSTDQTNALAASFEDRIMLVHQKARNGKVKAMDRAAKIANNEIFVFTDANTILNKESLVEIGRNFLQPEVGMVSGEKRVMASQDGEAASGEGLYWKFESWLKKLDSDVASVIGAAGELFAIRAELYDTLPADTLLDDFMLSAKTVEQGYRVVYEPNAYAIEYGSASYKDEWKRKVRICAGGVQSTIRSYRLFNIKCYGIKSFTFLIHRVSRWTLAPMALLGSFLLSAMLITESAVYLSYFTTSVFALGLTWLSVKKNLRNLPKPLLLIVYFTFMHASAIAGWFRYAFTKQSVNWDRAARLTKV